MKKKIIVSKPCWVDFYFMVGLWLVTEGFILYWHINSTSKEDRMMLLGIMACASAPFMYVVFMVPKFLYMIIHVQEGVMRSFLFGRLQCEVFTDREVYYAVVNSVGSSDPPRIRRYIIISNEPFTVRKNKRNIVLLKYITLMYIKKNKMVIIPYNDKTKHLFPIDEWNCVECGWLTPPF